MSHYTAGPWLISETGPKYSINAGNGGASTRHIAMVSCFQQYEGDSRENIANAYLIAAAPELLEAAMNLFADASDRNEIFDQNETMHNDWAALKRAIDKALGGIA